MKHRLLVLLSVLGFSVFLFNSAFAQSETPTPVSALGTQPMPLTPVLEPGILQWLVADPQDIIGGILLALAGALGASIIVFTSIGAAMPGTEAHSGYKEGQAQLAKFKDQWNKAVEENRDPDILEAIRKAWDEFNDNFARDARSGFAPAAILYVLIAAILAALFASSIYGGFGIGLGLTGIMSSIGIQQQKEKTDQVKNTALADLIKEAEALSSKFKPALAVLQSAARTPNREGNLRLLNSNDLSELSELIDSTDRDDTRLEGLHNAIAKAEKAKAL